MDGTTFLEDVGVAVVGFRDVGEVFWGVFFWGMDLWGDEVRFIFGNEMPQGWPFGQAKSKEDGFDMVLTGVSLGGAMAAIIGSLEGAAPHSVPRKVWTVKRGLLTHCNEYMSRAGNTTHHNTILLTIDVSFCGFSQ